MGTACNRVFAHSYWWNWVWQIGHTQLEPTHTWGAIVLRFLMVGLGNRFGGEGGDLETNVTRITTHEQYVASLMRTVHETFEEDWENSRSA
mgnify:CR=1 FL=1